MASFRALEKGWSMTIDERMEKVEAVTTLAYRRSKLALVLGLGAAALSVLAAALALWAAWHSH